MTRKKVTDYVDTSKIDVAKIDTEKVKEQAAVAAAMLADVSSKAAAQAGTLAGQAKDRAVQAKDWAEPKVAEFIAWLTPRAEKAWHDSVQAAAPRVEKAAEKAGPLIDTAHDKLVDDVLPKVVAAFNSAAASAAQAEGRVAAEAEKASRSGQKRGWLWALLAMGAATVGYVFWRRAQPQNDPWAEPWEQVTKPDYTGAARDARHAVAHAAESVGEVAGTAVAKGREAGAKAAQAAEGLSTRAAQATEEVRTRAAEAAAKASEAAKLAAERATTTAKVTAQKASAQARKVSGASADKATSAADDAAAAADEAADKVTEATDMAAEKTGAATHKASDTVTDAADKVAEKTSEHRPEG